MNIFTITNTDDAIDFFSLTSKHWPFHDGTSDFAFRGQANSSWELFPSVFRNKRKISTKNQIEYEYRIIYELARDLIKDGLYHPPINLPSSYDIQNNIDYLISITATYDEWPTDEFHEIIAIAQHYGLTTRFLDFTTDPFVALYFALHGSVTKEESECAVYVISTSNPKLSCDYQINHKEIKKRYQIIQTPTIFNTNLKAQKGIFIGYFESEFNEGSDFSPITVDEYLDDEILKICIPVDIAYTLLMRLYRSSIDSRKLFPGIEGIIRYYKNDTRPIPSICSESMRTDDITKLSEYLKSK